MSEQLEGWGYNPAHTQIPGDIHYYRGMVALCNPFVSPSIGYVFVPNVTRVAMSCETCATIYAAAEAPAKSATAVCTKCGGRIGDAPVTGVTAGSMGDAALVTHAPSGPLPRCVCHRVPNHLHTRLCMMAEKYANMWRDQIGTNVDQIIREVKDTSGVTLRYNEDTGVFDAVDVPRRHIELNEYTRQILGRPNFACHSVANVLRKSGQEIPFKAEEEQAAVIHWLLNIYLEHGENYEKEANRRLREMP